MSIEGTLTARQRFTAVTMTVAATHEDPALLRKLIEIAARACAVTNTLRRAAALVVLFEGSAIDLPVQPIG